MGIKPTYEELKQRVKELEEENTNLKKSEVLLRESEERFRSLFEHASIGIGLADEDGNIIAFNDAMLLPGSYTHDDIKIISNVSNLYWTDWVFILPKFYHSIRKPLNPQEDHPWQKNLIRTNPSASERFWPPMPFRLMQ